MNIIQNIAQKLDKVQQRHRFTAFIYAVVKKYGDDQAGYQAALLTYYAFLALFPLLLVLTTVTQIIATTHPHLQATIIHGITNYFPVLGDQLSRHVHSLHKSGVALIIGILFTLYGARGIADAFRHGINTIWGVPKSQQPGFPKSTLKSLSLVTVGGLGFIVASIIAGLAAAAGKGWDFRLLSIAIDMFVLFWLFTFLLQISLPRHVSLRDTRSAAIAAAIGLVLLQSLGGYLLAREVRNLDAVYSYFAIALGLLFWLYLQAQILYYAIEIASVKSAKLWPRGFSGQHQTAADRRVTASQS